MKALKFFIATAFMAMATGAFAQFTNAKSSSFSGSSDNEGWSRFSVSYIPSKMKFDVKGADDYNFQGFAVGWTKGFNVVQSMPIFVETGAALQFRTYSDSETEDFNDSGVSGKITAEERWNLFSLNIPINLIYKFNIDSDLSIEPLFGLDFRFNLLGKMKNDISYSGDYADEVNDYLDEYYGDELKDINIFDKDDMGEPAKRFQAGWHIGANINYKKLTLGITYGQDFNEIMEDCKIATTTISLGYNF